MPEANAPAPNTDNQNTPPAGQPNTPPAQNNEENKFRRLFEDADKKAKDQEAELAKLRDAQKARDEADLTEKQKADKRAEEAEKRAQEAENKATALEISSLRQKAVADAGLKSDAAQFITATDEAGIQAQIEGLRGLIGTTQTQVPPKSGGTVTQPPTGQQPGLDEQIAAAEKAGNRALSIHLKMQRMKG